MIRSNYQVAFSAEVLHSYFEKDVCRDMQFNSTPATDTLMKRFDCRLRHKINGFDFYTNTTQALTALLDYIQQVTGQAFFEFTIKSNHPHFSCFTELPVDWSGTITYDSGAAINTIDGNIIQLGAQLVNNSSSSPLGTLTVHFSDIANKGSYPQFRISFNARATQWQYFVVNRSAVVFDMPAIGKTTVDFSGPQKVVIDSGEAALLFSSGDNLIPLSEIPKYKFDLINNPPEGETARKSKAAKILFKGLPNPDPKRVGIVNVKGQKQLSSPMYIYL